MNIEMQSSEGLVCDNPQCDYKNPEVTLEQAADWVNRPCPKCGDNLLTEEDYKGTLAVQETINYMNTLSEHELLALARVMRKDESYVEPLMMSANDECSMKVHVHNGLNLTMKYGNVEEHIKVKDGQVDRQYFIKEDNDKSESEG